MAELNFDASQVAPDTGAMDALPAGWYNVLIDESEMKPTKDGTGAYLQTRFNIIDGQYAGRKLFTRLNVRNQNPVAQEIAYKQLSAIAHAVGVLQVADSNQLHGIPLKVKVKVRAASGDYEASNEITSYKNINENTGAPAGAGTAPGGMPAGFGGAPAQFQTPAAPQGFAPQQQQQAPAQQQFQQPQQQQQAPQQPQWEAPAQAPQPWGQPNQAAPQQQQQPTPQQQAQQQFAPQQAQQPMQTQPVQQQQAPAQQAAATGTPPWGAAQQDPQQATPPWGAPQ